MSEIITLKTIAQFIEANPDAVVPQALIDQFMAALKMGYYGESLPLHLALFWLSQGYGVTLKAIETDMGIKAANLSSYFRGKPQVISHSRVQLICDYLGVAVTDDPLVPLRLLGDSSVLGEFHLYKVEPLFREPLMRSISGVYKPFMVAMNDHDGSPIFKIKTRTGAFTIVTNKPVTFSDDA